jgi:hypothetical protein
VAKITKKRQKFTKQVLLEMAISRLKKMPKFELRLFCHEHLILEVYPPEYDNVLRGKK